MAKRQLTPLTFNGHGLTTIGHSAYFEYEEGAYDTPQFSPQTVVRNQNFPSYIGGQPEGKVLPLKFAIRSSDTQGQFNSIGKIFDPVDELRYLLVQDCDNRIKRVLCVPQQLIYDQHSPHIFTVPLFAPLPYLEDNTLTVVAGEITTLVNPLTFEQVVATGFVTNLGNAYAMPIFTVIPRQLRTNAQSWTKMREVTYCNRSEFPLTGPGSGTWLINVNAGGAVDMGVGNDVAVFVDEVQVPPEKVAIDAGGNIWIEIADAPAHVAYLEVGFAAGDLTWTFRTADHGFKVGDYLVRGAGTFETVRVQSVNGDIVTVLRAQRATVAGAGVAGDPIFRSGHHIQIAWDRTGLPARPANPDPPLINLATSTNLLWEWTTAPIWPDGNRRPGGWRRILYDGRDDTPDLRKNRLSAKTTLDFSGANVRFSDVEPTAAKPNFDAIEFRACCGIDDVLGAIEYDCTLGWPFALQVIGRDLIGLDSVVFNRLGHEGAAAHFPPKIYTGQQEIPAAILQAVVLRSRQLIVTTCRPSDTNNEPLDGACVAGMDVQGFRLDNDTQIIGIALRARDSSGNAGLAATINRVANSVDAIPLSCTPTEGGPGARLAGPFSGAGGLGAAFRQVCFAPNAAAAFTTDVPVIPEGDAFLAIYEATPGAGVIQVPRSNGSIYARGSHWEFDGTAWIENDVVNAFDDLWFSILSLTSDNQEESLESERTGETNILTNIKLVFDPDRTPVVIPRGTETAYYFDDIWVRGAETFRFRFLKRWADAQNNAVSIDIAANTVIDVQKGDLISATLVAVSSPWLRLAAGRDVVTVQAQGGAVEEDHTLTYRNTWQA